MGIVHKKICMVGDFAVGKTSLTRRFVSNVFSDDYITTVGVKIETCTVPVTEQDSVKLVIWDIAGSDQLDTLKSNYLQGASGYLLVADGTRRNTLENALALKSSVDEILNHLPFRLLINKADLQEDWEISKSDYEQLAVAKLPFVETSALSGEAVEEAFNDLAMELWQHK